ncbi:MAG: hypothetical protein A3G22_06590 [Alphaproteobacteria bacterium RIFCSPLOWO2_12_FULL_40_11]|nr:MAG: hypothetical protein A3G22_06590 [Alphaproteobacteria bacterium RIFCSPLOWO2_12_FULL_40_11]
MPPSFSKRVFLTKPPLKKEVARSAGGFLGDKLQFKVYLPKITRHRTYVRCHPLFQRGFIFLSYENKR